MSDPFERACIAWYGSEMAWERYGSEPMKAVVRRKMRSAIIAYLDELADREMGDPHDEKVRGFDPLVIQALAKDAAGPDR